MKEKKERLGTVKKGRTAVFIDASNIIYGCSTDCWRMDFKKLFTYLKERYEANKIFYFAGVDKSNKAQLRFYEKLDEFGYRLRLVPVKRFKDGTRKGDVDSKMTFELIRDKDLYDELVVMTGDGDYIYVLEYLLKLGKKVRLMGFYFNTARDLKKLFGEYFTDISRLRELLAIKKRQTLLKDLPRGVVGELYSSGERKSRQRKRQTLSKNLPRGNMVNSKLRQSKSQDKKVYKVKDKK